MGEKKRKLTDTAAEEPVAPEVKKMKKEKKEKREAEKDATTPAPNKTSEEGFQDQDVKEKKPKKLRLDQKQRQEKKERKKLEKKEKKEKKERLKNGNPDADEAERKAKKERKDQKYNNKKKAKKADAAAQSTETPGEEQVEGDVEPLNVEEGAEEAAEGKSARFICFVGNLPYSANEESMKKHFEKNPPTSIRVATKKEDNKKCRGFAFIEFDNFDRMKSCLKLYHHSTFDDGKYPPRAINVELTAGGGGNTDYRKGKIEAKNKKLFEERQRNAKQIQKDKKKHDKSGSKGTQAPTGANTLGLDGANDATTGEDDKFANVHPSRRPRMW